MNLSEKEIALLNDIEKRSSYKEYFLGEISSLKWFYPLKERDYFDPKNNPPPKESENKGYYNIPLWNVLKYLEKISYECKQKKNKVYAKELLHVIRNVSIPQNRKKADNYRTWHVFVKILCNLPNRLITLKDIDLIKEWYRSTFSTILIDAEIGKKLLPKMLKSDKPSDIKKAEKIVDILTSIKEVEGEKRGRELKTNAEEFWLHETLKNNCELLSKKGPKETISILENRIKTVIEKDSNDDKYSFVWLSSLSDSTFHQSLKGIKYLFVFALRNILIFLLNNKRVLNKILKSFLNEDLHIFKRLALFVIKEKYSLYSHLFWGVINESYFNNPNYRNEVYQIVNNNFARFLSSERKKVIDIINKRPSHLAKGDDDINVLIWRQRWLKSMLNKGVKNIDDSYKKLKEKTGIDPKMPETDFQITSFNDGVAPITSSELLKMSNEEVVKYLHDFNEVKKKFGVSTKSGLAGALRIAIKINIGKFLKDIKLFLDVDLLYQYNIIQGFEDSWKENKRLDWKKVLGYVQDLINKDLFWENSETYENTACRYKDWVVSTISHLIYEVTRNSKCDFPKEDLKTIEGILIRILNQQDSGMNKAEDALTQAINTAEGKTVEALIMYCIRYAKIFHNAQKDMGKPKWSSIKIKSLFKKALFKKDNSLEFSVLMGLFLTELMWIDEKLFSDNINKLFPKELPEHWDSAMQGYLFTSRTYDNLYVLMRENNHYLKGLTYPFKTENVKERLVQHICVAYLRGTEDINNNNSLFKKILLGWKEEKIRSIISFFWSHRAYKLENEIRERILQFWKYCFVKLKKKRNLSRSDKIILSDINLLTVFLKDFKDNEMEWIIQSVPYIEKNYRAPFLLEYLDKLVKENPDEVGEIYLLMLDFTIPQYDERHIKSIIKKLYLNKKYEIVNKIREKYYNGQCYSFKPFFEELGKGM